MAGMRTLTIRTRDGQTRRRAREPAVQVGGRPEGLGVSNPRDVHVLTTPEKWLLQDVRVFGDDDGHRGTALGRRRVFPVRHEPHHAGR
jgi:hypothetical protein